MSDPVTGERTFHYWRGRFYSDMGTMGGPSTDGDGQTVVGVWEMNSAKVGGNPMPPQARRVVIEPEGASDPSDIEGRTWQQRTIEAELAAADARARLDGMTAESKANARLYRSATAHAQGREEEFRLGMNDAYDKVHDLAALVASAYRAGEGWEELHWRDVGDGCGGEDREPCQPSIEQMHDFAAGVLAGTHPSVTMPELGAADVTEMAHTVGRALADGETLAAGIYRATRAVLDPTSQHSAHTTPGAGCKLCEEVVG